MQGGTILLRQCQPAAEIAGVPRSKRQQRVEKALESVELTDKTRQKAKNLSGGQKQRLAIARHRRAAADLFADEPTVT